jgi:hypothetical protein
MRFSALPIRSFTRRTVALLIIFFVFSVLYLGLSKPAFAQATTSQNAPILNYMTPNVTSDVPQNLHTYTQNVTLEVTSALICQLAGVDPLSKNGQCLGYNVKTGKIGYAPAGSGAIGAVSSMISVLFTPPIHTSDYIAYLKNSFGITKNAYAATNPGIGFEGLQPFLHAWVVFRNIAYIAFVIVFLLIGLAIMLRVRIDPRTVMTIQNQIPKIIIALILVTFSFAIAGLLIDLMWLSTYLAIALITQADPALTADVVKNINSSVYHPAPQFANDIFSKNGLGGMHDIAATGASAIRQIIQDFIRPETLGTPSSGGGGGGIDLNPLDWVGGAVGNVIGSFVSGFISWAVGLIAYLILIIAILVALIRLWLALLKAYISILIDVIFAPFWIIAGLIPGQTSAGFGPWLKDMAGNLAAFPATIFMFLVGKLFSDALITSAAGNPSSVGANLLNGAFVPPLLGSNGGNYLSGLVVIGIVLATPNVVDMTKKAFKASGIGFGSIGKSAGVGSAVLGGAGKTMTGTYATTRYNLEGGKKEKPSSVFGALIRRTV